MKTYKVSFITRRGKYSQDDMIYVEAENEKLACQKAESIVNDDYDTCPFGNHIAEISMDFKAMEIKREEADDVIF